MRTRQFGSLGEVPVVGQGTWNLERAPERQAIDTLVAGIEAGMTHIDTAELYGSGRVERLVGKALRGKRDRVFLVSKVLPSNATYAGTLAACERSLTQLGTDYLDVYLLHWSGSYPLSETCRAFETLEEQGKIRAFGVSNFGVEELEEVRSIGGETRLACNQVLFHLKERSIEHHVIPWCAEQDVAVVGYSPFGNGDFPSPGSPGRHALARVADGHGCTPYQAALAFLLERGNVFVIPKAATVEHALQNAAAADVVLDEADVALLDQAFPARKRRGLAMI